MTHHDLIQSRDRILFQGDSITNAFRKPEEISNNYQLGAGYAMIAAARLLAERPDDDLTIDNRGVSGEGVAGLRKRWQEDCLALQPTLLSILVGVNDAHGTERAKLQTYESQYRELLTITREALPDVRLVLGEPFLLDVGSATRERLGVRERAAIVRVLAEEFGARFIPYQQVFDEALARAPASYWSFDGVHPSAQGHWLMAQAWLRTVTGDHR